MRAVQDLYKDFESLDAAEKVRALPLWSPSSGAAAPAAERGLPAAGG